MRWAGFPAPSAGRAAAVAFPNPSTGGTCSPAPNTRPCCLLFLSERAWAHLGQIFSPGAEGTCWHGWFLAQAFGWVFWR